MFKKVVYFVGGCGLVIFSATIKDSVPNLADNLFSVGIVLIILAIAEQG